MRDRLQRLYEPQYNGNPSNPGVSSVLSVEDRFSVINPGTVNGNRRTANPIEFSKDVTIAASGLIERSYASSSKVWFYARGPFTAPPPPPGFTYNTTANNVYNEALGKLHENLRTQIDLSIDLLQGGATLRMLKPIADTISYVRKVASGRIKLKDLKKDYKAFKKNSKRLVNLYKSDPKQAMRTAGGRWLEFVYGIRPFCQEIHDVADEIGRSVISGSRTIEGRARQITSKTYGISLTYNAYSYPGTANSTESHRVQIKAVYNLKQSVLQTLANFTSINPASMAWENIPFSFVADWFVDVGGYLRELETALLYRQSFVTGFVTYTQRLTVSGGYSFSGRDGTDYVYANISGGTRRYSWKKRVVLTSQPLPRVPQFEAKLGSGRLLNAAALLSQLLKK